MGFDSELLVSGLPVPRSTPARALTPAPASQWKRRTERGAGLQGTPGAWSQAQRCQRSLLLVLPPSPAWCQHPPARAGVTVPPGFHWCPCGSPKHSKFF